jgi:hypothetical protein
VPLGEATEKLDGVENAYNVVRLSAIKQSHCLPPLPFWMLTSLAPCFYFIVTYQPGKEDGSRSHTRVPGRTACTSLFYAGLEDM